MIAVSEPSHRRRLRVAIVMSLLFHGTGAAIYGLSPLSRMAFHPNARPTPEQIVAISDSMRIEKKSVVPPRSHLAPAHAPRRPQPQVPQPQPVAELPVPRVEREIVPPPPTPKPVPQHVRHELAKSVPHASAEPPKTVVAVAPEAVRTSPPTIPPATPEPTDEPTAAPPPKRPIVPPKTVALAEQTRPQKPTRPTHAHLTAQQIAQIDSDLAKSIAHDRSEENPLRVPKTAASAIRRYKMSVDSVHVGSLKAGEGTYWPIDNGRRASDGYTYYHCAYAYQWADGTFEHGVVPWLVRFAPSEDPILHPELEQGGPIGLPPPPPGFQLAAGQSVGRALRGYFPGVVFADQ